METLAKITLDEFKKKKKNRLAHWPSYILN